MTGRSSGPGPCWGTLHIIPVDDVLWVLSLVAPGVIRRSARREQELALTGEDFRQARELVTGVLAGGRSMTRPEIYRVLTEGGISPEGQRGYHILFRLGLEAVICFGTRKGKEHTFVLLEEWAGPGANLGRDEALAELARRYFSCHGPATLQDFYLVVQPSCRRYTGRNSISWEGDHAS